MHVQYCTFRKFPEFPELGSFQGEIPNGNSLNSGHRNSRAGNSRSLSTGALRSMRGKMFPGSIARGSQKRVKRIPNSTSERTFAELSARAADSSTEPDHEPSGLPLYRACGLHIARAAVTVSTATATHGTSPQQPRDDASDAMGPAL